jgi:hypothetical protein
VHRHFDHPVYWPSHEGPVMVVGCQRHLNLLDRYSRHVQTLNFMKIRPVGAELFNSDGQTDKHDVAKGLFRNIAKALNNQTVNAAKVNNHCLFRDPYKKQNKLCGQNVESVNVKLCATQI